MIKKFLLSFRIIASNLEEKYACCRNKNKVMNKLKCGSRHSCIGHLQKTLKIMVASKKLLLSVQVSVCPYYPFSNKLSKVKLWSRTVKGV